VSYHENYHDVVDQMRAFGVEFRERDLPLHADTPKRKGCGNGGKWWYWLRSFTIRGRSYLVGRFGSYKSGESLKVEWDAPPLSEEDRARFRAEREAAERAAAAARQADADFAAASAREQWQRGSSTGSSAYLTKKGVDAEACRYLPDGSILVPLLRYDFERAHALRAVQRIYPGPRFDRRTGEELPGKTFTRGFDPYRCSVRLGLATAGAPILVCEGYATGLTLRMACDRRAPVFVALNAGNLLSVCQLVRELHHESPILLCADDDWRTKNHRGEPDNVGRRKAHDVALQLDDVHLIYPVFGPERGPKDTDFNDLHARVGLAQVRTQLLRALRWLDPETYRQAA
jgi:putative DNA primase/helicase